MGIAALIILIVTCFFHVAGIYAAHKDGHDVFFPVMWLFALIYATFYLGTTL